MVVREGLVLTETPGLRRGHGDRAVGRGEAVGVLIGAGEAGEMFGGIGGLANCGKS